jgi:hypothetical protein
VVKARKISPTRIRLDLWKDLADIFFTNPSGGHHDHRFSMLNLHRAQDPLSSRTGGKERRVHAKKLFFPIKLYAFWGELALHF